MSVSARSFRAAVYAYSDAGADGVMASRYLKQASDDDDGLWWASRAIPTGREYALASRASERADAVLGFSGEVPLDVKGCIAIDGQFFRVLVVLPRVMGQNEQQVLAVYADAADFSNRDDAP